MSIDHVGSDVMWGRPIPKYRRVAYCFSERCNSQVAWRGTTGGREIKNATPGMDWCPICGHALYFEVIKCAAVTECNKNQGK